MRRVTFAALALGAVVAVALVLAGPATTGAAQGASPAASPTPHQPGELALARREYRAQPQRLTGTLAFVFIVGAFDTSAHAHAALEVAEAQVPATPGTSDMRPVPIPRLADEAGAYAGRLQEQTVSLRFAVLLFRVGPYDFLWEGVGYSNDPLPDLLAVAQRRIASAGTPPATPVSAAQAHSLLTLLPRLTDLPVGGYVLTREVVTNGAGTPVP